MKSLVDFLYESNEEKINAYSEESGLRYIIKKNSKSFVAYYDLPDLNDGDDSWSANTIDSPIVIVSELVDAGVTDRSTVELKFIGNSESGQSTVWTVGTPEDNEEFDNTYVDSKHNIKLVISSKTKTKTKKDIKNLFYTLYKNAISSFKGNNVKIDAFDNSFKLFHFHLEMTYDKYKESAERECNETIKRINDGYNNLISRFPNIDKGDCKFVNVSEFNDDLKHKKSILKCEIITSKDSENKHYVEDICKLIKSSHAKLVNIDNSYLVINEKYVIADSFLLEDTRGWGYIEKFTRHDKDNLIEHITNNLRPTPFFVFED